tara:strand:+ start:2620 stop:2841 length:222 start_codon:yes stop_codon:yes gene_type:complete
MSIGRELYKSLLKRYQWEVQSNKSTLLIYFKNSVGIGEHPQHLDEMDKILGNIAEANDKLENLQREFPWEDYK